MVRRSSSGPDEASGIGLDAGGVRDGATDPGFSNRPAPIQPTRLVVSGPPRLAPRPVLRRLPPARPPRARLISDMGAVLLAAGSVVVIAVALAPGGEVLDASGAPGSDPNLAAVSPALGGDAASAPLDPSRLEPLASLPPDETAGPTDGTTGVSPAPGSTPASGPAQPTPISRPPTAAPTLAPAPTPTPGDRTPRPSGTPAPLPSTKPPPPSPVASPTPAPPTPVPATPTPFPSPDPSEPDPPPPSGTQP
jgi:hypothetical protein